jgi:hypothetical protein
VDIHLPRKEGPIMYAQLIEDRAREHVAELLRVAEHDRLVDLATGPGRPIRYKIADWLYSIAERLEGSQPGSVVHARPQQEPA